MGETYGATRTFGFATFSTSGAASREAAILSVYERAFELGFWSPPDLREKWWQLFRPTTYDSETIIFIQANPDWKMRLMSKGP